MAVKRILPYLQATLSLGLFIHCNLDHHLFAYYDAGWGGDPDDRRSQQGYAIFYGGKLISLTAKK